MLRRKLAEELLPTRTPGRLAVTFQSFGFKYGPAATPTCCSTCGSFPTRTTTRAAAAHRARPAVVAFINPSRRPGAFYDVPGAADRLRCRPSRPRPGPPDRGDRLHRGPASLGGDRRASRLIATATRGGYLVEVAASRCDPSGVSGPRVIDHVGFEVADLAALAPLLRRRSSTPSARARMHESEHAVAYGINGPLIWFVVRGRPPGAGLRPHRAAGQRQGGGRRGPPGRAWPTAAATTARPGQRPAVRARATTPAYLRDPDGLRVEIVSRR